MRKPSFDELVEKALAADKRYDAGAYHFVREALDYTQEKIKRADKAQRIGKTEEGNHVSGQELLEGARDFALANYGPMAITLFDLWGIKRCEDIGEIVFNMIEHGGLNKRDTDSREDFKGGYDFEETFRKPFLPVSTKKAPEPESP